MLNLAKSLTSHKLVNIKIKTVFIDNLIFWLHYRVTVLLLLVGVLLLSSKDYIGENIRCIFSTKDLLQYINRYCFFMSTFTVVKHLNKSVLHREIAHPGVGPFVFDAGWKEDEIKRHTYYQWVVFVLFVQSIFFYLPHLLWRHTEEGKLKLLVGGIKIMDMLNAGKKRQSFVKIETQLKNRMYTYRSWTCGLIFYEFLNLMNLIFQVYITDKFLNHNFLSLGSKIYWDLKDDEYNPLDIVFPKVAKCSFQKFGPSGTIQFHDILCVLPLNIVNEKIYITLWFWYIILGILSIWILLWRLLCVFLRKWDRFNNYIFNFVTLSKCDSRNLIVVMRNISYGEWVFLRYLARNMKGCLFNDFIEQLVLNYDRPPLVLLPINVFEKVKPQEKSSQTSNSNEKLLIDFMGR